MKLSATIWLVFAFCLLLVLAAMGWLSATALRLDRAEIEARRQAALEEKVRLALWRMDSALAPTVAQESARPYFAYLAYFPADRSFNRMFNTSAKGETLIASPLLLETPPRILLHFQIDAAGNLSSPQVPSEDNRKLIGSVKLDAAVQANRERQFARLRKIVALEKFADLLSEPKPKELKRVELAAGAYEPQLGQAAPPGLRGSITADDSKTPQSWAYGMPQGGAAPQRDNAPQDRYDRQGGNVQPSDAVSPRQSMESGASQLQQPQPQQPPQAQQAFVPQQIEQSRREYAQRAQSVKQSVDVMAMNSAANLPADYDYPQKKAEFPPQATIGAKGGPLLPSTSGSLSEEREKPSTDINGVLMTPLWIDGELLLARRVLVAGQKYVQGCLLDWPDIRGWLKNEILDLLPDADLVAAGAADTAEESRLLAALPIRLVPGAVAVNGEKSWSPLLMSLLAAWFCLLLTAGAIACLLAGVMRLSARRASFVTAVTHELRTPLTTFQMYAEMLAEGMVPEESQRREYLQTLRVEAVRLTHLVENVLAYARLERGRLDRRMEIISLGDLIGSMQSRLADRAAQAGMKLVVEAIHPPGEISVKTNVSAVEQILFNLVDNACKYAASGEDKRIHLVLHVADGHAEVRVEDHGPGIAPEMRGRLFHSFSKTAKEAAQSAPGVGLGLALSRRLARDLGGDLRYSEQSAAGACFILTLPKA
ncbi:MAG: HAMP domain-containing histidine kinase [Pirellulales bacterium]|nr:HAMP domain-containing histidine kinase [Pirellulales bacterium]